MTRLTETELKLGLPDEAAWAWVREQLGPGPVVQQHNHFFDRADRALRARRIGVRLRAENGRCTLTLKADRSTGAPEPITRRLELESPIEPEDFERSLAEGLDLGVWVDRWRALPTRDPDEGREVTRLLDGLDRLVRDVRLERYAGFSNRRERLHLVLRDADGPLDIEIELDRTELPGSRLDYEIEVEAAAGEAASLPRIHRALVEWLDREGGIRTRTLGSKLARLNAILESGSESGMPGAGEPTLEER